MGQQRPFDALLLSAADVTTNPTSATPFTDCSYFNRASAIVTVTGTSNGVLAILLSNDQALPPNISTFSSGPLLTVTAPGQYIIQSFDSAYRWLACQYTNTSGTGTVTVKLHGVGSY